MIEVYIAEYPFAVGNEKIYSHEREREIKSCKSKSAAESKFYVWKLFEYAVEKSFKLKFSELDFIKNVNGKWQCEKFAFSLSHSGSVVAVALSDKPVGLDIEVKNPLRFLKLRNKILTESEKERVKRFNENKLGEELNILWTEKEAVFKLNGGRVFIPDKIETAGLSFVTETVKAGENEYYITVASQDREEVKIIKI